MSSCSALRLASWAILVALPSPPGVLAAQAHRQQHSDSVVGLAVPTAGARGKQHAMFTPTRGGTAADTARALAMVERLREAIAPYADTAAAAAAGYRLSPMAAMQLAEMQRGKHLVHMGNRGLRPEHARNRPGRSLQTSQQSSVSAPVCCERPQALLYRRAPGGGLILAGAMFTAPASATIEDLDARIPLSVARWHKHTNVCVPPRGTPRSRVFRRANTPDACREAGGRFREESGRYMVHVMTDAGEDLAGIFPQGREHQRGNGRRDR